MDNLSELKRDVSSFRSTMDELRIIRSFMQERGMSYEDAHEAAFEAYNLGHDRMARIFRDSADEI